MKEILLRLLVVITIMISAISITVQQQTAQAYPCIGGSVKEYCIGYHDGAIQAHRDFYTGHNLGTDQHQCKDNSTEYCNGYDRGYNDEADFLG